jgi:CBS domain-containing protein
MHQSHKQSTYSPKDLLSTLATTRDNVRLQLNLMSKEARDRWRALETNVEALQAKLLQESDKVSESVSKNAQELTEAVHAFLHEQSHVVTLSTPVKRFMQKPVSCSAQDGLARVAQIMWELDCGAVPVVSDGALVGMVTDRDACMAAYTSGRALADIPVAIAMSQDVLSIDEETTLQDVLALLRERRIRRVPVTKDGGLIGIVSLADIARWIERHGGGATPAGAELAHTLAVVSEVRGSNRHAAT